MSVRNEIAAVARLVKTGRVKLIGQIRDECVADV